MFSYGFEGLARSFGLVFVGCACDFWCDSFVERVLCQVSDLTKDLEIVFNFN